MEETAVGERSRCTQTGRWPAIRLVSIGASLASLTAVILSSTPTRVSAQTPDPTLLPIATIAQIPLTSAYGALNVLSRAAGSSYLDPVTGATVYKITASTFPASAGSWGHDYSEGGAEVVTPRTRYLSTGISVALAAASVSSEHDHDAGGTDGARRAVDQDPLALLDVGA